MESQLQLNCCVKNFVISFPEMPHIVADFVEGRPGKNWCFWTVVLEKTLERPLDCKEIRPVNLKGNQSWIFTGRTDAEAPIFWPPDAENWLIGKDTDARKDGRQEEKGVTEDEMIRWHHWLDGHEFEQAPGVGGGQGSLAGCSPWGHKELDTTEQLNWLTDWTHTLSSQLSSSFINIYLGWLSGKEFSAYAGDTGDRGLISGSGRSSGGGNGNPPLEEEILAWRIPWSEDPGGLQSIGLQRVRHNWATKHGQPRSPSFRRKPRRKWKKEKKKSSLQGKQRLQM